MSAHRTLAANPFFDSPAQRVALARRRFFDDGVRPSGMVSEAVLQSWARCVRHEPDTSRPAVFEPVTPSRVHSVLRANRQLLEAAEVEMQRMRTTLAGTSSTAMLTDALGVVIGSTFDHARSHEKLMPIATRVGVNLAEEVVGTNAPGLTARSGQPCVVMGGEHYFANVHVMQCAAAPIRDVRGCVAGVLDLSSEGLSFGFDAAAVVAHYAAEIENRLLCAQSREHLVVRLQISPAMLDTPLAGLVGVTGDGRIDWANAVAARMLGLPAPGQAVGTRAASVEDHFGLTLSTLADGSAASAPRALRLPSGLMLWARCEWHTPDAFRRAVAASSAGGAGPALMPQAATAAIAAASEPGATLRDTERQAIERMVLACQGNVSQAARRLGISRGRIYRQLQRSGEPKRSGSPIGGLGAAGMPLQSPGSSSPSPPPAPPADSA